MTTEEWNQHSLAEQKDLISRRNPSGTTVNPQSIRSSKAQELLARLAEAKEHTYALQQLWVSLEICTCAPDAFQFNIWFSQHHSFETIEAAFGALAIMLSKLRSEHPEKVANKSHMDKIKYASKVMFNIREKAAETK